MKTNFLDYFCKNCILKSKGGAKNPSTGSCQSKKREEKNEQTREDSGSVNPEQEDGSHYSGRNAASLTGNGAQRFGPA
jgi:hypothetical protein